MMNITEQHIDHLLNLFMQGESTLEHEHELAAYFATTPNIPKQWKHYKEMFAYFDSGMPINNANNSLLNKKTKSKSKISKVWWIAASAAATVAIAITLATFINNTHSTSSPASPPSTISAQKTATPEHNADTDNKSKLQLTQPTLIVQKNKVRTDSKEQLVNYVGLNKKKSEKKSAAAHSPSVKSIDIERELGQVEQAQQELMADRFIMEQEREELKIEQGYNRAQVYQARQTVANNNPQVIQVVFK